MQIEAIHAYLIFDSRGNPTVEAVVTLQDGTWGRGVAPSGASTGQFEAHELRDGDARRFRGKSVDRAIANINDLIGPALGGMDVLDQRAIDARMIELDGTPNKSHLGANAILAVSTAVASAAARARDEPLYRHFGEGTLLPIPEIQMIGGGAHANWRTDIQDFLLIATGARSYLESLEITFNVFHAIGDILKARGDYSGVADEGGYWPNFDSHEAIFETIVTGIENAGYRPGHDAGIGLDIAASDLFDFSTSTYRLELEQKTLESHGFLDLLDTWCETYPVVSVEDPAADVDIDGWKRFYEKWGSRLQIVGDDLFTTNISRIRHGISEELANAVLIKLNQIGTVSETLDAIRLTREAGWTPVVSARSGETEDTMISHLAVGTGAGQLKVGSFTRSERMAKWNEVLRIQHQLGSQGVFSKWYSTHPCRFSQ